MARRRTGTRSRKRTTTKVSRKYSKKMGKRRGKSRRGRKMRGGSLMSVLNKALVPAALFTGSKMLQKRSKRKSGRMNFKRLKNTLRNKRRRCRR